MDIKNRRVEIQILIFSELCFVIRVPSSRHHYHYRKERLSNLNRTCMSNYQKSLKQTTYYMDFHPNLFLCDTNTSTLYSQRLFDMISRVIDRSKTGKKKFIKIDDAISIIFQCPENFKFKNLSRNCYVCVISSYERNILRQNKKSCVEIFCEKQSNSKIFFHQLL